MPRETGTMGTISYHESNSRLPMVPGAIAKYHRSIVPRKHYFPSLRGRRASTWGSEGHAVNLEAVTLQLPRVDIVIRHRHAATTRGDGIKQRFGASRLTFDTARFELMVA